MSRQACQGWKPATSPMTQGARLSWACRLGLSGVMEVVRGATWNNFVKRFIINGGCLPCPSGQFAACFWLGQADPHVWTGNSGSLPVSNPTSR